MCIKCKPIVLKKIKQLGRLFLHVLINMNQIFLFCFLYDPLPVEENLLFCSLPYIQNFDMVALFIHVTVPVIFKAVQNVCQESQVSPQLSLLFLNQKIHHFLLQFLNRIQLFINICQGCCHENHSRITDKRI